MGRPRPGWRIIRCAERRLGRPPSRRRATRRRLRPGSCRPRRKSRGSLDATQGLLGNMSTTLLAILLGVICLVGLALVALGLPGLWLIVVAVVAFGAITGFKGIGLATIVI